MLLTEEEVRGNYINVPEKMMKELTDIDVDIFISDKYELLYHFVAKMNVKLHRIERMEKWFYCHPSATPGSDIDLSVISPNIIHIFGRGKDGKYLSLGDEDRIYKYQDAIDQRKVRFAVDFFGEIIPAAFEEIRDLVREYEDIGTSKSVYEKDVDNSSLEKAVAFIESSGLLRKLESVISSCFMCELSAEERFDRLHALFLVLPVGGLQQTYHGRLLDEKIHPIFKDNFNRLDPRLWLDLHFLMCLEELEYNANAHGLSFKSYVQKNTDLQVLIKRILKSEHRWEEYLELIQLQSLFPVYQVIDRFGGPLKVHPSTFVHLNISNYLDYLLDQERFKEIEPLTEAVEWLFEDDADVQRFLKYYEGRVAERQRLNEPDVETSRYRSILRNGEGPKVEFKSTFRWDIDKKNISKDVENAALKAIVGFMNAEGGVLLIGVDDNSRILGLKDDYKTLGSHPNRDEFMQVLERDLIKVIGKQHNDLWRPKFLNIDGLDICTIEVDRSKEPVWASFKEKEELFVRGKNSTRLLEGKQLVEYIKKHFEPVHEENRFDPSD